MANRNQRIDQRKIVILSGGSATNELTEVFKSLSLNLTFVLPVLDNGGSTSELIRVIGGPAIGDIRSRLTRLIPSEQENLRSFLSYRLSADPKEAKTQWDEIVEGSHSIWADISPPTRELFRAFLIHCNVELLKRSRYQFNARDNRKSFRYELANVGNLFLTGARLFLGSLDAAIELFSRLTGIETSITILPCINTNFTYHISAVLENGLIITGQSQISHPSPTPHEQFEHGNGAVQGALNQSLISGSLRLSLLNDAVGRLEIPELVTRRSSMESVLSEETSDEESGNIPQYIHPELKKSQLHFNKSDCNEPLLSPIQRIFYISPYGEEICPSAYTRVISSISSAEVVIYSIGSLMTSIVPILILKGVGKSICNDTIIENTGIARKKILLLNGSGDRETFGMCALDFLDTIIRLVTYSLTESKIKSTSKIDTEIAWNNFITHLFYIENSQIPVDVNLIEAKNVKCVKIKSGDSKYSYNLEDLEQKLRNSIFL